MANKFPCEIGIQSVIASSLALTILPTKTPLTERCGYLYACNKAFKNATSLTVTFMTLELSLASSTRTESKIKSKIKSIKTQKN